MVVVAISSLEEDHVSLEQILSHSNWKVLRACTCQQALVLIRENQIPVAICERDLPDGDWKDILAEVARLPNPPKLIVTSRLADDCLWAEVLNLGGWDVLAKPFDLMEVTWSVSQAWRHWKPVPEGEDQGGVCFAKPSVGE